MIGAACLTVGSIHLFGWLRSHDARTHLLFSSSALSAAVVVEFDVALMHAKTPAQYGTILRWMHVPLALGLVSVTLFSRQYLGAGETGSCGRPSAHERSLSS